MYHLHSTASTFCGGEDDDGLIPVSDEADDMDAPVCDTEHIEQQISIKVHVRMKVSLVILGCLKDLKEVARSQKNDTDFLSIAFTAMFP